MDLEGKTALVTGAGSGIGRATAILLAQKGASVLVADIDETAGQGTTKMIASTRGRAAFVKCDATREGEIEKAIRNAAELWGSLDVMFNNAGILTGAPAFPETPAAQWSRVVQLNFWAVIRGTQAAIESMKGSGGGVIVNTASMAGVNPWPMDPVYSATKGGVVFFTKALAWLASSDNIRVNCVCPTLVETPLLTDASDLRIQDLTRITRLKPDHVAKAVLRLIEDEGLAGKALTVLPDQEPAFA
jgi:NAD(P)-dependent dehydrogenase (short-subunit alcohol dehydrogenase family)